MAWALVFSDLPAGTPEAHKVTTNLRKDLFKNGHMMIQFSMYARPSSRANHVET